MILLIILTLSALLVVAVLLLASSLPVKNKRAHASFVPIKAAASGWTVKHNHKVNVYLLSATLNSPNEPAGGLTATSSASVPPPTQGEAQTQHGPLYE